MKLNWRVRLGILLVLLSILFYIIQYLIFQDPRTELFYIGIDISFIPIEVLVVVLVIERAISEKEKQIMLEKMNMVIGAFFSDMGTQLLEDFSEFDEKKELIREELLIGDEWTHEDFLRVADKIREYDYNLNIQGDDPRSLEFLESIKEYLISKREFLLRLLENPNLLEHDSFTDLLWAVFHFTEELEKRKDLSRLPLADYNHLSGDASRAYGSLIMEWLQYMEHLMYNYPYLFSLALRTNPFDPEAQIEIIDEQ